MGGRGYCVTAILRRLQEFGGVCIPSIVRDSKCGHHLLLAPKTLVYLGWVADKVWWGWGPFPSLPSPTQTTRRSLVLEVAGGKVVRWQISSPNFLEFLEICENPSTTELSLCPTHDWVLHLGGWHHHRVSIFYLPFIFSEALKLLELDSTGWNLGPNFQVTPTGYHW